MNRFDCRKIRLKLSANERGQSILEFLLLMPITIGLITVLVKINTVIQSSIVNQKYVRAQVLYVGMNSAEYPRLGQRARMAAESLNQVTMGMNEEVLEESVVGTPHAPHGVITRKKIKDKAEGGEATQRAVVSSRTTATLCSPSNVIKSDSGISAIVPGKLPELSNSQGFIYCYSPLFAGGSE